MALKRHPTHPEVHCPAPGEHLSPQAGVPFLSRLGHSLLWLGEESVREHVAMGPPATSVSHRCPWQLPGPCTTRPLKREPSRARGCRRPVGGPQRVRGQAGTPEGLASHPTWGGHSVGSPGTHNLALTVTFPYSPCSAHPQLPLPGGQLAGQPTASRRPRLVPAGPAPRTEGEPGQLPQRELGVLGQPGTRGRLPR